MPKVSVQVSSRLDQKQCFDKVSSVLSKDADLKKLDSAYASDFDASKFTGHIKGKQFKADIKVKSEGAGSSVTVDVDLPLTLAMFKGMIEKSLKEKLSSALS